MVKKILIQLAIALARDPKNGAKVILYVFMAVFGFFILIASIACGMISGLSGSDKYLDKNYKIEEEPLYKDIDSVYREFEAEMQEKMSAREAEIIAEHTETVETEDGGTQSVCNVTVSKQFTQVNYAYVFSYITHKHPVKEGEKYKFDKKEIKGVFERITQLKESNVGNYYRLYTEVLTPEKAAEIYFTKKDERQMYEQSYELYGSFLAFSESGTADNDMGDGNGSPGVPYTHITTDAQMNAINNCNDDIGKKVLEFAMSKLGYPYSQAQRDDGAHFDCSSLCFYAYQSAGITLMSGSANTAAAIANYCSVRGQTVSYEQLQPGDLIFYCCKPGNGRFMGIDHVAMYAGNGMIVDASASKGYVVYRNVFWRDRIVLCGRPR